MDETPAENISTALVEIEPGLALVFGDVPQGESLIPFTLLPDSDRAAIEQQFATAVGVGNFAAQTVQAISQASGLVRLAPETIAALASGARTVSHGGYSIGTLAGANGQFTSTVLWSPAAAAGTASALAGIGPAVALLAIQVQLNQISAVAEHALAQTQAVLETVRAEQWAELSGLHRAIEKAVDEAMHIGGVSETVWQNVQSSEASLEKQRALFSKLTDTHGQNLGNLRDHAKRRDYLVDNSEAILQDAHGALVAHNAWFKYQALRASHVSSLVASDERNARLLDRIVSTARADHVRSIDHLGSLIDSLQREMWVLSELPGNRTLPFLGKRKKARDVAKMATGLASVLESLGATHRTPRQEIEPPSTVCFGEESMPAVLMEVLRWRLSRNEQLEALAQSNGRLGSHEVIVLTSERLLATKRSDLERYGAFEFDAKLSDFRYVRLRIDAGPGDGRVDLVTQEQDKSWRFAKETVELDAFSSLVALMQRHMHVPAAERDALREFLPPGKKTVEISEQ